MKKIILLCIPILLIGCGCWPPRPNLDFFRETIVYDDVEACGVTNPIENLAWLNDIHNRYDSIVHNCPEDEYFYREICILENLITGEKFIYDKPYWDTCHDCRVYRCDGSLYDYKSDTTTQTSVSQNITHTPSSPQPVCAESLVSTQIIAVISVYRAYLEGND